MRCLTMRPESRLAPPFALLDPKGALVAISSGCEACDLDKWSAQAIAGRAH